MDNTCLYTRITEFCTIGDPLGLRASEFIVHGTYVVYKIILYAWKYSRFVYFVNFTNQSAFAKILYRKKN